MLNLSKFDQVCRKNKFIYNTKIIVRSWTAMFIPWGDFDWWGSSRATCPGHKEQCGAGCKLQPTCMKHRSGIREKSRDYLVAYYLLAEEIVVCMPVPGPVSAVCLFSSRTVKGSRCTKGIQHALCTWHPTTTLRAREFMELWERGCWFTGQTSVRPAGRNRFL